MSQFDSRRSQPPSNGGATRPNSRPNPALQPRKPVQTYRARPEIGAAPVRSAPDIMTSRAHARYRTEAQRRLIRILIGFAVVLFVVGGGALYFLGSQAVTTIGTITRVSNTPVPVRPNSQGTPVPVTFPNWDKKEPVNILLIGLDWRPENSDTRADTMIVVHIDPANKTAAMLSIPRDLWVPIPGFGEDRVNAAFQDGESNKDKVPGGGPSLAMATIEDNFGIPINYYAWVNFTGFEQVVDAVGGVTIDVPRPLVDNDYPLAYSGGAATRIYIPAGIQHMDGKTALEYARSRPADSDLGRNSRQQQVLLAIRQQALNLNLISKLPNIADKVADAVKTDLSFTQVGSLALLGKEIGPGAIQTVVLDPPCVNETVLPSGADVLMPDWTCIRPKVVQAFADPALAKENARLEVLNGTTTNGIGRKVHDELVAKGFNVVQLDSASDQGKHPVTSITDFSNGQMSHTIQALTEALGLDPNDVIKGDPRKRPVATADGKPIDIEVIAGDDKIK